MATLFACSAILLSIYISKHTFGRILSTVDELSRPNRKMQLVNNLFRSLARLDQLQRDESVRLNTAPDYALLKESRHFRLLLDTLREVDIQNKVQVRRIDSMQRILHKRDMMFVQYFRLHTALIKNDTLAARVQALSDLLNKNTYPDNNLLKTSKTTEVTIDTLHQESNHQSLWKRIFSKSRSKPARVNKRVEQSVQVYLDTLSFGKSDTLTKMGRDVSEIASNRIKQRKILIDRRAALNRTSNILTDQLLRILNEIQKDELANVGMQNATAYNVVGEGLAHINVLIIVFVIGTLVLISLILADISRSNRYRRELLEAKEAAEEAGRVKQRFLSNMSHELRTPLQTIIGVSEQVMDQQRPSAKSLENIHQSSLHLLQIVNEVLDYSHISSGKYTLRPEPFNMHGLLEEIQNIIRVQADRKKLDLIYDVEVYKARYYLGDPFRLKQILLNLLGNAVKFTDKGSVTLSVNESRKGDGFSFAFVVEDTGPGISIQDQEAVFSPFEQGSGGHRQQGAGLGLSIVKSLVELQNGKIEVESKQGGGARFVLSLSYAETVPSSLENKSATVVDSSFSGHVWLVDDDALILQLCSSILGKYGVRHTSFSSPADALAANPPTDLKVVFLDIRMNKMTGVELCRHLKQKLGVSEPLFVALTAQALPDEQEAILQQGFDRLLMKPFLERDFIGVLMDIAEDDEDSDAVQFQDLSAVRKMAGGDEELVQLTLQSFLSETKRDLEAANRYFIEDDANQLSEVLHRLAGRCGMMGASGISAYLRMVEVNLRMGKYKVTASEMREMNDQVNAILVMVDNLLIV